MIPLSAASSMPIRCAWTCAASPAMDDIDRQIVALLRENARRSFQDIGDARLAERAGGQAARRPPRGRRRDPRLRGGRRPRPRSAGARTRSSRSTARGGWRAAEVRAAVAGHPEVAAAYTVAGEASAILHVRARDTAHLEEALERIRDTPGITRTQTQVVLSTLFERPVT